MDPPLCLTTPWTTANPRPVPLPTSLVVKNGSKMRDLTSADIPLPVSVNASMTWTRAGIPDECAVGFVQVGRWVSMVNDPPRGMASRALTARFMSTCPNWPGSTLTRPIAGSRDGAEHDILAEQASQHPLRVLDHDVEVEHLGLQHGATAEGEELAGEGGGAGARLHDGFDGGTQLIGRRADRTGSFRCIPR